jgi:hypothetical protein
MLVLHYTKLKRLLNDKHPSLWGELIKYKENEVAIRPLTTTKINP